MPKVHQLTRQDARRVAIKAQLLERDRPDGLLTVARRLSFLQLDPVSAVAPSADLVAWSRLGSASSTALRRSAGEYAGPSRLQATRSALGATALTGSSWSSVSRRTAGSRPAAWPPSSSCALTATRRASCWLR